MLIIYTIAALITGFAAVDKVQRHKARYKHPWIVPIAYALGWPLVVLIMLINSIIGTEGEQYDDF